MEQLEPNLAANDHEETRSTWDRFTTYRFEDDAEFQVRGDKYFQMSQF